MTPALFATIEGLFDIDFSGIGLIGVSIGQGETYTVATPYREIGNRLQVFSVHCNRGPENGKVGPGNGADAVFDVRHPWHGPSVIEAQSHFHAERDFPTDALDDADDVGIALPNRHEVDKAERSIRVLEGGLENQCVGTITASRFPFTVGGSNPPVAVLFLTQKSGKTCVGGDVRPAQPVDGAIPVHERRGFAVANQSIIFNSCSHIFPITRGVSSSSIWACCFAPSHWMREIVNSA